MSKLLAPFPWFGGKSRVAAEVWAALGDVDCYVEPFAGSLAVLLGRPEHHVRRIEIVNDADMYIANFWRAVAADPDAVAHHADWPSNECDLFARHLWLVNEGRDRMQQNLLADPNWCDAKIAGWWVWGISQWIGGGWCSGKGPWTLQNGSVVRVPGGQSGGRNAKRQRMHLSGADGIFAQRSQPLHEYMNRLATRLRNVRVVCGDWSRVVTRGATSHGATVGVFLDPPYSAEAGREPNLYAVDSTTIAHDVRRWAIEHGDDPRMRIVLAGYDGEHDMPASWRVLAWKAGMSYQTSRRTSANAENRHRERLWFSPHCLSQSTMLFEWQND